jgi:succinate dehydrogenase/fumarate reductase flavoprotein subunit
MKMALTGIPKITADILIIGGGSAGSMAAIRAKELNPDSKVVLFEKSDFQYSGTIPRGMDALNVVTVPGINTAEDFVTANRLYCDGVCDDIKSYTLAKRSYPLLQKLMEWGVCFPRKDGNFDITTLHPHGRYTVSMTEPDLKQILVKKALSAGCRVENRTMAVGLLKEGDAVAGALGLNVRTGERILCTAKAVILTAGGTARFGLPPSGNLYGTYDYPGNTGDGYLLGYRAGASLTGMEFTLCYCLLKDLEAPGMAMMLQKGAHLLDAAGGQLFKNEFYSLSEVNRIQNSPAGPLRIRLSHLPEERIQEVEELLFSCERPIIKRFLEERGLNFRKSDLELATSELFLCGGHGMSGLQVDENAATTVAGLYAAGDTAPAPRGFLTGAFVFGEIAAESAVSYIRHRGKPLPDESSLSSVAQKLERAKDQAHAPVAIRDLEFKIRRSINEYLTPPKNEYKMRHLLRCLDIFKKDLAEKVRIANPRDLFLSFEAENIIDSAILSTTASLERKESRWGFWHSRGDHPDRDDANWLKHIDLFQNAETEAPEISCRPVRRMAGIGAA